MVIIPVKWGFCIWFQKRQTGSRWSELCPFTFCHGILVVKDSKHDFTWRHEDTIEILFPHNTNFVEKFFLCPFGLAPGKTSSWINNFAATSFTELLKEKPIKHTRRGSDIKRGSERGNMALWCRQSFMMLNRAQKKGCNMGRTLSYIMPYTLTPWTITD